MTRGRTITVTVQRLKSTLPVRMVKARPGGIWFEGELQTENDEFPNGKEVTLFIDGVEEAAVVTGRKWTGPFTWLDGHWEFDYELPIESYKLQARFKGDNELLPSLTAVYPVEVTEEKKMLWWEMLIVASVVVSIGIAVVSLGGLLGD